MGRMRSLRGSGLLEPQQTFDKVQVGLADFTFLVHQALALLGFLSKNVTFKRFLEGDFAGAGDLEPLFGTRVGFNLWHVNAFCMIPCWRICTGRSLMGPCGLIVPFW